MDSQQEMDQIIDNEWSIVRDERNTKLAACDWIVTKSLELGEAIPEAWLIYRQGLRDITLQEDPFNVVWPTPPA